MQSRNGTLESWSKLRKATRPLHFLNRHPLTGSCTAKRQYGSPFQAGHGLQRGRYHRLAIGEGGHQQDERTHFFFRSLMART